MRLRGKSWQFRAYVHGRYVTGTLPPEGGHAVGEKRAARELRRWVTKKEEELRPVPSGTVDQLWVRWWKHASPAWAPGNVDVRESIGRVHVLPRFGEAAVTAVTTEEVDDFFDDLRDVNGLAPATIVKIREAMLLLFDQAVTWKHIAENPVKASRRPKIPKKALRVPTVDEIRRLLELAEATNPEFTTYLQVAVDTGARRSMIVGLRWENVHLEHGELVFAVSAVVSKGGVVIRETTKNDTEWRVSLHPTTVARLQAHYDYCRARADAVGVTWSDRMYLFSKDPAAVLPWTPRSATQAFGRLRQRAGVPTVRLHDLRHFMATTWLSSGSDSRTVMGRGGWQDQRSMERYSHFVPAVDRADSARIGNTVFGTPTPKPKARKPRPTKRTRRTTV